MHYKPFRERRLVAVYNVTDTENPTRLFTSTNAFKSVEIDGVEQESVVSNYTFDSIGEHTVKYKLIDSRKVNRGCFSSCKNIISVVIPHKVTTIEYTAFSQCENLVSVTIPDTLVTIEGSAFIYCKNLTSLNIFEGVTSIGNNAFQYCYGLTSINIPDSVTSIGSQAFDNCTSATTLSIGKGVTSIGDNVFTGCSSFTSITVNKANTVYDSRNNCNAVIEKTTNKLVVGGNTTVIPTNVSAIGNYAFHNRRMTEIIIPNNVTTIGDNAFNRCETLKEITIGSSVTTIGSYSFQWCVLEKITSLAMTAPTIQSNTFQNSAKNGGRLFVPTGSSGYNEWMSYSNYYLGTFNWILQYQ